MNRLLQEIADFAVDAMLNLEKLTDISQLIKHLLL